MAQYLYSDVLVCEDQDTAKRLSFDPRVGLTCVTVDGDIYTADGVVSGGQC